MLDGGFHFSDKDRTKIARDVLNDYRRQISDQESAPRGNNDGELPHPPWYHALCGQEDPAEALTLLPEFECAIASLEREIDICIIHDRKTTTPTTARGRGRPRKTESPAFALAREVARFIESFGLRIARLPEDPRKGFEVARKSLLARLLQISYRRAGIAEPAEMWHDVAKVLRDFCPEPAALAVTEQERRFAEAYEKDLPGLKQQGRTSRITCDKCSQTVEVPAVGKKELGAALQRLGWQVIERRKPVETILHFCPHCARKS